MNKGNIVYPFSLSLIFLQPIEPTILESKAIKCITEPAVTITSDAAEQAVVVDVAVPSSLSVAHVAHDSSNRMPFYLRVTAFAQFLHF